MPRTTLAGLALVAALALSAPAATVAQSESPEGTTWHLAGYTLDDVVESVPWLVDATLLLESGTASGSGGCNSFSGSYTLDGDQLTFEQPFTVTLVGCPQPQTEVEDAYLSLLPQTATWQIDDGVLTLADELGNPLLDLERAVVALTQSDLNAIAAQFAAQEAQIARVGERIDNIRVGTLRDRIKRLEASVKALQGQVAASAASAPRSGSGTAYNAEERVLLKAIPPKVEQSCRPLRSSLPGGTVAAVACDGFRDTVAEQAYYLMEWQDAVATMKSVASANGAPNRPRGACFSNKPGWLDLGPSVGAEACWIDGGRANYRLITRAAGCKQLDVAGTRLTEPAIYLAMEARNRRLEPLRAAGLAYTDSNYYIMNFEAGEYIPAGNLPRTPGCRAHTDIVG
jgi:heat shock protein HslJ